MSFFKAAVLGLVSATSVSCTNMSTGLTEPLESYSAKEIYDQGGVELSNANAEDAARYFGEIERLYPYSKWAKRGLIMQAFSFHKAKDYNSSRSAAQRYIDFFPADVDAGYAQYLLALSYYDQIDDVGRDQGLTIKALQALQVVIERYPSSKYVKPAQTKFDLAFDHLSAKEMEIGRYYLQKGHYTAAINRFKTVVEDFRTTRQAPEALHRLVESYLSLGLKAEAQSAVSILKQEYKNTEWYKQSTALLADEVLAKDTLDGNWLSQIYRQTIKGEWL
ncbi:MAG: outer membrane protein assembly factor BamD [Planktomarina sp.]|nr:outer membrane protein assembly factor BamD [Planktomarina sp.]|tara:strand:- start:1985 stop:2815 length:831 start_codon:yes stop_codon:yes gene_type:complete